MRLAAIDIGSNAARLLISDITTYKDGTLDFTKVNLVRVPLRLGFDVFENGTISTKKRVELLETIQAFKHLMNVYQVKGLKVCATSAMRDATNSAEIVEEVYQATGIRIRIITGSEEAEILYETHLAENMDDKNMYLYIDVGGGSTELTFFGKNNQVMKKSFDIGTIRLLKGKIEDENWEDLKLYVKGIKTNLPLVAIGSGGNINKIFSLSKRKQGKPLPIEVLREYYKEMSAITVQDRIHKYGFREDRADVIVPALQIYTSIMRWAGINEILVPQIGLADGLIKLLYQEMSFTSLMGKPKPLT
ncbi:MAG TPA: exopolyphosphatase [Chitinophagaceae bacterium]|nr:exopolyphosphatase [Chitinophagaceae bacterium]